MSDTTPLFLKEEAALGDGEDDLVTANKKFLTQKGVEFATFIPTSTGLKKSILDATQPVRTLFELASFHFYWEQGQGPQFKKKVKAFFLTGKKGIETTSSLYRPVTKKGDPRMWFTKLGNYSIAWDIVAIIIHDGAPYLINLSRLDLKAVCDEGSNAIKDFIDAYLSSSNTIPAELLGKLKELAKKPIRAIKVGDTAIGMSIEAALGIKANSSKKPDYKGIELKSSRNKKTRTTLFAQVADWSMSVCKSSAQIVDKYGYDRDGARKLYCTIKSQKPNSQGLSFKYNKDNDLLEEIHSKDGLVATWSGDRLRSRLKEKHAETFFIHAESEEVEGKEFFYLKSVIHTKGPLLSQLMPLIEDGTITMDHLIKRQWEPKKKVSEKGPLFKINESDLEKLFPAPVHYDLI